MMIINDWLLCNLWWLSGWRVVLLRLPDTSTDLQLNHLSLLYAHILLQPLLPCIHDHIVIVVCLVLEHHPVAHHCLVSPLLCGKETIYLFSFSYIDFFPLNLDVFYFFLRIATWCCYAKDYVDQVLLLM
jgi:hypothetical protein